MLKEGLVEREAPDVHASDPRWQLVERVLASNSFSRAARLSSFLQYVCERQIAGRTDEITEQQIGVHVFGRQPNYNPGDDNIVRTTARLVRQRLDLYFFQEGAHESIRILIPKGSYVPFFEPRIAGKDFSDAMNAPESMADTLETAMHTLPSEKAPSRKTWWLRAGIALLLFAVVAGYLGIERWRRDNIQHALWSTLFRGAESTMLVPGDSGLVMFENLTHHTVDVTTYALGTYRQQLSPEQAALSLHPTLEDRRYTSLPDLEIAAKIADLPESKGHLQIRYARDLKISDLKNSSAILVGDPEGNPWVQLFDNQLNFRFQMDEATSTHTILNTSPAKGEQAIYICSPADPEHHAYALIALVHNLSGNGNVLLIEGTTMAGIEAASDFLSNRAKLNATLADARAGDGSLRDFEVLLGTRNIDASSPQSTVLAKRIH